jgi:signal transduction histidine kinase
LIVFQAATLDGQRIGTVYLKRDLTDVRAKLMRYAQVALLVLLISPLVSVLVSSLLQRWVARPLRRLAHAAGRVSAENNYSIRVPKGAEDEIGALVDRFNEMLDQVEERDEALRAARDQLEDRVLERTSQLQNEIAERKAIEKDLVAAKEAAEEASRAKSMFLANMSHELRTPLNAIIGYSELLEEEAQANGQQDSIPDLRRIHGSGKHLLGLISDVLDLSKIEAGHLNVNIEEVSVGCILDDVTSTAEILAGKNHNQFEVICEDRDALLRVDPLRFRQSLLNLLANAAKFTEHGEVSLRVAREDSGGRPEFAWTVADTGIGIAPHQVEKLFQSFSQVDNSNSRRYGGTGLGLAISQKLCQKMGGQITVQSEPGKGSRFTIHVPALPGHVPAPPGLTA